MRAPIPSYELAGHTASVIQSTANITSGVQSPSYDILKIMLTIVIIGGTCCFLYNEYKKERYRSGKNREKQN
jgi:hypothetical protein